MFTDRGWIRGENLQAAPEDKRCIRKLYEYIRCWCAFHDDVGEKNLLDAEVKQMYQKAGISHVLAISGLHISVIGMGLYKLLRKIKCSFLTSGVIAGTVIGGYGMMSGLGTSTIRAVLMFFVLLFGQWIGRSYDTLSALGLSAIVILLDNPYLLWYAGFLCHLQRCLELWLWDRH